MRPLRLRHHDINLVPKSARVILRPFIPGGVQRITTIIGRALALSEAEAQRNLASVLKDFEARHLNLEASLLASFEKVLPNLFTQRPLSKERKLFIGALFSGEYALESAALFNPSIVPHPDQEGVAEGALRFIMSLRATGEGHISSVEFRTGLIGAEGDIRLDPVSRFVSLPTLDPDPSYKKVPFVVKLHEMGFDNGASAAVMEILSEGFTRSELFRSVQRVRRETQPVTQGLINTLNCIQWLADSNYEMDFPPELAMSERVIFPVSPNESNGIEDARFVRFTDDDGTVTYYATYTAYNGHAILPQLIETQDFLHFRVLTLNGSAVQNKGMALFPRRIDGNYAMLSRQDDENLFIMFSDNHHYWSDPRVILQPAELHWGSPAGSQGPGEGAGAAHRAPDRTGGRWPGRLRPQRGLQLWLPHPSRGADSALRHERPRLHDRQRISGGTALPVEALRPGRRVHPPAATSLGMEESRLPMGMAPSPRTDQCQPNSLI